MSNLYHQESQVLGREINVKFIPAEKLRYRKSDKYYPLLPAGLYKIAGREINVTLIVRKVKL